MGSGRGALIREGRLLEIFCFTPGRLFDRDDNRVWAVNRVFAVNFLLALDIFYSDSSLRAVKYPQSDLSIILTVCQFVYSPHWPGDYRKNTILIDENLNI